MKKFLLLFLTLLAFSTVSKLHLGQINLGAAGHFALHSSDGILQEHAPSHSPLTGDIGYYNSSDLPGFGYVNYVMPAGVDLQTTDQDKEILEVSGSKGHSIDLATAGNFGILAATTITNSGNSEVNGLHVGLSPGTAITGFPPGVVNDGEIYAHGDSPEVTDMLILAKQDLETAYLAAEAATTPAPVPVAGDLGGSTLYPGIYNSTSTLVIDAGDLTLDAQGDPDAEWIFQMGSTLTTVAGTGGNVVLAGGAQADNIIWQVGSSATIGDYTSFYGNILARTSITMNTGATIEGRLLANDDAVTLTSTNIIDSPSTTDDPYPVELISFEVKKEDNAICITWTTATEINNDYFTVERAADSGYFQAIGTVEGAGNSNEIRHYSFIDTEVLYADYLYYRIKQTDYDGTFTYSWIEYLINGDKKELNVFPNPVSRGEDLTIQSSGEMVVLSLYNNLGVLVQSIETGQNQTSFSTNLLKPGLYFVLVTNPANQTSISEKVIIR